MSGKSSSGRGNSQNSPRTAGPGRPAGERYGEHRRDAEKAPIGYRKIQRPNEFGSLVGTVETDPERAAHIRWAFDAYATGEWTLTRMAAELDLRGFTTVPTAKRPARPIRTNRLHMILTNPLIRDLDVRIVNAATANCSASSPSTPTRLPAPRTTTRRTTPPQRQRRHK